jgi:D-lyxose ketol-isomerase
MKRSEINAIIRAAEADFAKVGFALPGFAAWGPEQWHARGQAVAAMAAQGLGWDITDFGSGSFATKGLLLFTVRNGSVGDSAANRPYAEKIMISRHDQVAPLHRHWIKVEDIINRGALAPGATLAVQLFGTAADGSPDSHTDITAYLDGMEKTVAAGTVINIEEGASITLFPGTFHALWGAGGDVVVGEVSSINDDYTDNYFAEPVARFADIDEDEPAYRALVTDHADLANQVSQTL